MLHQAVHYHRLVTNQGVPFARRAVIFALQPYCLHQGSPHGAQTRRLSSAGTPKGLLRSDLRGGTASITNLTAGVTAIALLHSVGGHLSNAAQRLVSAAPAASTDSLTTIAACLAAAAVPLMLEEPAKLPLATLATCAAVGAFLLNNVLWGTAAAVFTLRAVQMVHSAIKPYAEADHTLLLQAIPATASILSKGLGTDALLVEAQQTNRLQTGCLVLVNPGEAVPLDGNVVWGSSTIEVPCMHKDMPKRLRRAKGAKVLAGCVNSGNSVLIIQATCSARDTEAAQAAGLRNSMGRIVLPFELQTAAAGFMITDHKFKPAKQTVGRAVSSLV